MNITGTPSFRVLQMPANMPDLATVVERMAATAMPPMEALRGEEPISGWVTGRHMLDRNITPDTAIYGGYLRVALAQAERVAPAALVKAEVGLELAAHWQNAGLSERREITRTVRDRLNAGAQPTIKGIHAVFDWRTLIGGTIYTSALSERQLDALQVAMIHTLGFTMIPECAANLARQHGVDVGSLDIVHFTEQSEGFDVIDNLAFDFLTWLWFVAEAAGGVIKAEGGDITVFIEGPLRFASHHQGAHDVLLQNGNPTISAEAKTALLSGKKLTRCKVALSIRGENPFHFTFVAGNWTFQSFRFPPHGMADPISSFQTRMDLLAQFRAAWRRVFREFLDARNSVKRWEDTLREINQWATARRASA
jgi:hypothetical protein